MTVGWNGGERGTLLILYVEVNKTNERLLIAPRNKMMLRCQI